MSSSTTVAPDLAASAFDAQLRAYRDKVTPFILESIPDREPKRHLYDLIAAHLSRHGKGVRPALCLATCRAFGGTEERALPSAAAIELLHNAFLVHDDVEDDSEYRRNSPTLNQQYGIPLAVNAGDAMNAMSLRFLKMNLSRLGPQLAGRVLDEFDHMAIETIEGQAMELGWIRDNDCTVNEQDYLLLVLKKTAWYSFIQPARIGAVIAQPGRTDLDAFNRLGYYLGAAFQIQDDVLNLVGDRKKYGKEIGGDLLEGKRTLILAHLFQQMTDQEKRRVSLFLGKPRAKRLPSEVAWIYELLRGYGSIEYARRAAQDFATAARSEFETAYAGAQTGGDLEFLRLLANYLVQRDV